MRREGRGPPSGEGRGPERPEDASVAGAVRAAAGRPGRPGRRPQPQRAARAEPPLRRAAGAEPGADGKRLQFPADHHDTHGRLRLQAHPTSLAPPPQRIWGCVGPRRPGSQRSSSARRRGLCRKPTAPEELPLADQSSRKTKQSGSDGNILSIGARPAS